MQYQIGDKVEAFAENFGQWLTGIVVSVEDDGAYVVAEHGGHMGGGTFGFDHLRPLGETVH